jgi:hypothetical protein
VAILRERKVLRIRGGTGDHRFIGIWVVVVNDRIGTPLSGDSGACLLEEFIFSSLLAGSRATCRRGTKSRIRIAPRTSSPATT